MSAPRSSGPGTTIPGCKYVEGEKILAYHGTLIYEAKILKVEGRADPKGRPGTYVPWYRIHYQGWKDRWDEWVQDERIMKFTEENNQLRRKIEEDVKGKSSSKKKSKGQKSGKKDREGVLLRDSREKLDEASEKYRLTIPPTLMKQLVVDMKLIQSKHLVPLPRRPCIREIFEQYQKSFAERDSGASTAAVPAATADILKGLQEYFEKSLGTLLLYRFERPQFSEVVKAAPNKPLSETYGAEHLLRLFVKLPQLVQVGGIDDDTRELLRAALNDLLQWMDNNHPSLFIDEYEPASPQYRRAVGN